MFKLQGTELNKRRYEMLLEAEGFQGLGWEGEGFDPAIFDQVKHRPAADHKRVLRV